MANTRNHGANDNNNNNNSNNNNNNPPPPPTLEQVLIMQAQMLQTMQQTMANMQQAQGHQPVPQLQPRDKLGEFQMTKPPTFSHSVEPMDADDWLKTIEKKYKLSNTTTTRRFCLLRTSWKVPLQIGGMLISNPTRSQKASTSKSSGTTSGLIMCHSE
jgi:hypothetical protein